MNVELSKNQCENLANFIDLYLLAEIRDNEELERDMLGAMNALMKAVE